MQQELFDKLRNYMLVSQNKRKGYRKNKNPNSTERYKMKKLEVSQF